MTLVAKGKAVGLTVDGVCIARVELRRNADLGAVLALLYAQVEADGTVSA